MSVAGGAEPGGGGLCPMTNEKAMRGALTPGLRVGEGACGGSRAVAIPIGPRAIKGPLMCTTDVHKPSKQLTRNGNSNEPGKKHIWQNTCDQKPARAHFSEAKRPCGRASMYQRRYQRLAISTGSELRVCHPFSGPAGRGTSPAPLIASLARPPLLPYNPRECSRCSSPKARSIFLFHI